VFLNQLPIPRPLFRLDRFDSNSCNSLVRLFRLEFAPTLSGLQIRRCALERCHKTVFFDLPELSGKQVGLLKEIVPRLSRIAIFGIPGLNAAQFAATETAVRALALEAEVIEVRVADDFEPAVEVARTKHVEGGILLSSPLVFVASKQIGEIAIAKRLPLISLFGEFPKSGGLLAYGPNVAEIFRRSGEYVGKILHGAKPSDLPIQRPEKFDLVINLKTATALGLDVPTQLQQLADEVIE
jgi:putative tryptophan/tyrosine transport system substrate-binding protein